RAVELSPDRGGDGRRSGGTQRHVAAGAGGTAHGARAARGWARQHHRRRRIRRHRAGRRRGAVLTLDLQVYQNPYLPRGATEVNAIVSVSAGAGQGHMTDEMMEVFLLDCSASMTDPPSKLAAVRDSTIKAIDRLRDGPWLAVGPGRRTGRLASPT